MRVIEFVDEAGNRIAEVFDDVPNDGEIVTLEHPLLGGRVDYVVSYHPRPPHRWYVDNGDRQSTPGGVKVTLMPTAAPVRVTVREPAAEPASSPSSATTHA